MNPKLKDQWLLLVIIIIVIFTKVNSYVEYPNSKFLIIYRNLPLILSNGTNKKTTM